VRACGSFTPAGIRSIWPTQPQLNADHCITDTLLVAASRRDSAEYVAIEVMLNGPETPLHEGVTFHDKDGHERDNIRVRWWNPELKHYRSAALIDEMTRARIPDTPMEDPVAIGYSDDKPLFIGHYWMTGEPEPLTPTIACLDYSAGKEGPLVAYRWDGESQLRADKFFQSVTA
jgi:hypothetical protein